MPLETLRYGEHDLQTITVAYPALPLHADTDDRLWVILIHGGAWRDPTQTAASYLTPALTILQNTTPAPPIKGIASISYRLSLHPSHPQDPKKESRTTLRAAKHPDHLSDIQSALSFLEAKYKIGCRYLLSGHSCGATLAFQCVMGSFFSSQRKRNLNGEAGYAAPLAILGMAGIYDLRLLRNSHKHISAYQEFIEGAFGSEEGVWDAASPGVVRSVDGVEGWEGGRLVVLAHSQEDSLCDTAQSDKMRDFLGTWEKDTSQGKREAHFLSIVGEHDEAWEKGRELARGIIITLGKLQEMGLCPKDPSISQE
ncbi:arylformamidase [Aspergillus lucknowensis]|uniref:Kynurenine formamidase n=1 Tax=Aspergillus lucknowensis TaxID=176173 RepID=A0ABR4M668_9EURO